MMVVVSLILLGKSNLMIETYPKEEKQPLSHTQSVLLNIPQAYEQTFFQNEENDGSNTQIGNLIVDDFSANNPDIKVFEPGQRSGRDCA